MSSTNTGNHTTHSSALGTAVASTATSGASGSVSHSSSTAPVASSSATASTNNQWLFRKEDMLRTPSQLDGVSLQEERESRFKGVTFIVTASVDNGNSGTDIGATCVYLASKTEESTRKFKDVIITCAQRAAKKDTPIDDQSKVRHYSMFARQDMVTLINHVLAPEDGKEHTKESKKTIVPHCFTLPLYLEYRAWKETIMYMEELLLEALCFDLSVEHPYAFMLTLIDNHYTKDPHRARKLKQVSWAFINDSLRTTLCLIYPPKVVALAAIHLAAKYLDENLSEGLGDVWRELFEPDVADITDAANEILEQYSQFGSRGSNAERGAYPGSKPGSEYQENGTPVYSGYLNSPAKLTTPVYSNVDRDGRT
ncbi:hypothetical protein BGW42_000471 [Actinomortierella wolfii]|nr:hypothetical protein BGW42_000471 [Actinomortierella wolfii]